MEAPVCGGTCDTTHTPKSGIVLDLISVVAFALTRSCVSDDEDGDRPTSKSKLHPTRFNNRTFRPKLLATAIWRKTYRPDSNFIYYWLMLVTLAVLYNFWIIPLRATFYTGAD